jgi:alkyl sulfatase BDS1-like metallo-beta-lactamase superfamily hydrolase
MSLRDFCDRVWKGEVDLGAANPVSSAYRGGEAEELTDGVLYYKRFASVTTVDTGDSLVMLDSGGRNESEAVYKAVRGWRTEAPLSAAVFSHHHVDHIFGVDRFDAEAVEKKRPRPLVYGHEAIPSHFDRYKKTRGWNAAINLRQFIPVGGTIDTARAGWPGEYRYPDVTYRGRLSFRAGDLDFELHHARGETEDNTWTWVPALKLLAPGDLFIWCSPNAGNPQKVQRWVGDWAAGLRRMAALDAEIMVPGHGWPIFGSDRIKIALGDTADLLESIEGQTLALMNTGASLDRILHEVELPKDALEKPYLRPVYDHPEFLIRNVWRLYGGWYDGQPDHLLPAPRAAQAREWVQLAGGIERVLERARALMSEDIKLACHVVEYAVLAAPSSAEAHALRSEIYDTRARTESSLMARGIFTFAAASSRAGKRDAFDP